MTSAPKTARVRSPTWENHFAFDPVPRTRIGEVKFHWNGKAWRNVTDQWFWALPGGFTLKCDPIREILKDPKGCVAAYSKGGKSMKIKDPSLSKEVVFENNVYEVVAVPSAYEVWIDVKKFNVLGFLGYCEEVEQLVICGIDDGIPYGAMSVNFDEEVAADGRVADVPAYAPQRSDKEEVEHTTAHVSDEERVAELKDRLLFYDVWDKAHPQETAELRARDERILQEIIDPTFHHKVVTVVVTDDGLQKILRRKSSVDRIVSFKAEKKKAKTIDPFQEFRDKLGLKDGEFLIPQIQPPPGVQQEVIAFPLPIAPKTSMDMGVKANEENVEDLKVKDRLVSDEELL